MMQLEAIQTKPKLVPNVDHLHNRLRREVDLPALLDNHEYGVTATTETRFGLEPQLAEQYGSALGRGWLVEMCVRLMDRSSVPFSVYTHDPISILPVIEAGMYCETTDQEFHLLDEMTAAGLGEHYHQFLFTICLFGFAQQHRSQSHDKYDAERARRYGEEVIQDTPNPALVFIDQVKKAHPQWMVPLSARTMSEIASFLLKNETFAAVTDLDLEDAEVRQAVASQAIIQPVSKGIKTTEFFGVSQLSVAEKQRIITGIISSIIPTAQPDHVQWQTNIQQVNNSGLKNGENGGNSELLTSGQLLRQLAVVVEAQPGAFLEVIEQVSDQMRRTVHISPADEMELIELMFLGSIPTRMMEAIMQSGAKGSDFGDLEYLLQGRGESAKLAAIAAFITHMDQPTRATVLRSFYNFFGVNGAGDGVTNA